MSNQLNDLQKVRDILAPLKEYTVERILGTGAMGYVVQVRHRVLGRRAIKLVHPNLLRSQVIRTRFDNEAVIMSSLRHINVVQVFDMGTAGNDYPYILMEFLEGGTLEDHMGEFGAMPPKQAVQVAVAILRGLQAAHDKGIVHRDIKPQNVLFDRDGTPKLTDFGIAHVQDGTRSLTREGSTIGTWVYMPLEQRDGEIKLIDHRVDTYAVGVVFYEILTKGNLGTELFSEQLKRHPERLEDVQEALRTIILKATALDREERFPSAAAMADELERIAEQLPEDPEGTPALGSAPGHRKALESAALADAAIPRMGGTMVPGHVQHESGNEVSSSSVGEAVSHIASAHSSRSFTDVPVGVGSGQDGDRQERHAPMMGTIQPDGIDHDAEAARIKAIRHGAKRRVLYSIVPWVIYALPLLAGIAGVWFVLRPVPAVKVEPVIEPVAETSIESITTEVVEPLPTLAVEPVEPVAKEPTPAPVVKPSPTLKVVVKPTPKAAVTVEENAQVRLILKSGTTATVTLTGDNGTFVLTGGSREVPQGTYSVSVEMPGRDVPQTGTLTVTHGLTTLTCNARFKMCKWRK